MSRTIQEATGIEKQLFDFEAIISDNPVIHKSKEEIIEELKRIESTLKVVYEELEEEKSKNLELKKRLNSTEPEDRKLKRLRREFDTAILIKSMSDSKHGSKYVLVIGSEEGSFKKDQHGAVNLAKTILSNFNNFDIEIFNDVLRTIVRWCYDNLASIDSEYVLDGIKSEELKESFFQHVAPVYIEEDGWVDFIKDCNREDAKKRLNDLDYRDPLINVHQDVYFEIKAPKTQRTYEQNVDFIMNCLDDKRDERDCFIEDLVEQFGLNI